MEQSRTLTMKHSENLRLCKTKKKMMTMKVSSEREGLVWNVSCFKNGTLPVIFVEKFLMNDFCQNLCEHTGQL